MINFRWLLILDDKPAPDGPEQRYRLWLVELDEEQPAAPQRCDSLDDLYQAIFARQRRSCEPPSTNE